MDMVFLLDNEKQKNRDEERENAQAFGKRDADENAPELTIGSGWIAQGTQKKITENQTDANRGGARANRGETCAYKPTCCGIHFALRMLAMIGRPICCSNIYSVARMNCVVEIDASEDGEDISLQDGDEQLECRQHDGHREWQWCEDRKSAGAEQAHDEPAHHLESDVPGKHVGEKTNRKANRTGKKRDDFDWHQKRHQRYRHARRHEQLQKTRAIMQKAIDDDDADDKQSERRGHRDLTCHRKCVWDEPDEVAE